MLISGLGEFGLIERFRKRILTDSSVIKGSGDDCAVLRFSKKYHQLYTCDMIVEDVDFTLKDDPYLIGRKAVAISLSDIASCAGMPRHCVISLGLPKNTGTGFIDRLFKGMLDIARLHKLNIVGGDLSRSESLVIDVSMLGLVEPKRLVLRSGAKAGDVILVTGSLGGSIHGKHLCFSPRLKEARYLVSRFRLHSMIDISDGLIQDLRHIVKESSVGARIYQQRIPMSEDCANIDDALYSGEDFELLFTLSPKDAEKLLRTRPGEFTAIGEVVEKKYGFKAVDDKGREKPIRFNGFRHF
jgi:thiamine-monophosphate kinase